MEKSNLIGYLTMVSNNNLVINFVIHVMILVSIALIYFLKDESKKKVVLNSSLLILFLSVTVNALIFGNPFHVITFSILTVFTGIELIRGNNGFIAPQINARTIIAMIIIMIGLWYPEFVEANVVSNLFVSPLGVVPCPTLLTALGLLNLYYPNVSKRQLIITTIFGIIYGFVGTFKLGVYLDISLIGAVLISIYSLIKLNYSTNRIQV